MKQYLEKLPVWIKDYLPVWAGVIVFLVVAIILFNETTSEQQDLKGLLGNLDTASAIALGALAFFGYWQYSREKSKRNRQVESILKQVSSSELVIEVALFIQFGGSGDMTESMENSRLKLLPNAKVIRAKSFGDSSHKVDKQDVIDLKEYCINIRSELAKFDVIHVFYGGTNIGGIVISDILNNTSNLIYYHKDGADYYPWYGDNKHVSKEKKTLVDAVS